MTNPHRHRNRASPEHIESIRNINLKIKQNNRRKTLQGKMQKMAARFTSSFGPDWDAIDAFKGKKKYTSKSKKFESTGNELKLNGHIVARHHKDGIEVSNAGHDTNKTYSTIKGLGIHARNQKGITKLNNKVIDVNSGEFVLVPHKEISDSPITYTKTKPRKRYRSVQEQSKFRDLVEKNESEAQGRKNKLPLSQISIQPKDQKQINKITGVKSPIGKEILGVEAHHILSHKKNKGLSTNPNNGIMIPKQDHKMLTSFAKLKGRLQKIAAKGDIIPTKYYGHESDKVIKMKPKEYLDKTSSTGLQESIAENRKIEHNSGAISDLNNTHSGNPTDNNYVRENTKEKKYYIEQDKDGNYTSDFHKYYKSEDMEGVNELDFIDENTKPTTYEGKTPTGWRGHDTRNKILGTGEDTTGFDRTGEEIFRGDEAGSTEYFKRKLRRGSPIERPFLSVNDKNKVTSHEGRHRSRAMMEEGVTEEEVNVMGDMSKDYYGIKDIISGQQNSLDEVKRQSDLAERIRRTRPFEFNKRMKGRESESVQISPQTLKEKLDKIKEDTRAPIFGRFSKLKQKIALIKSHVANQGMQADKIVDSYLSSGMGYKGMDGVYDHENSTVLDGFNDVDSQRMQDLFNGQGKFIGTNSVTDTRAGSNHDIERVRKELREVEEAGGIPALGFDGSEGGSLEALNISVVNSKEEVMNALSNTQWGTGILGPDRKFWVEESSTYKGRSNI